MVGDAVTGGVGGSVEIGASDGTADGNGVTGVRVGGTVAISVGALDGASIGCGVVGVAVGAGVCGAGVAGTGVSEISCRRACAAKGGDERPKTLEKDAEKMGEEDDNNDNDDDPDGTNSDDE